MPSDSKRRNPKELIFVNQHVNSQQQQQQQKQDEGQGQGSGTTNKQATMIDDEKVDMEIIILNPRRDKSKSTSKSTQVDDEAAEPEQISTVQSEKQPTSSSALNETLLKRLEKQYGQKRIVQADDNTYVDYMDYF